MCGAQYYDQGSQHEGLVDQPSDGHIPGQSLGGCGREVVPDNQGQVRTCVCMEGGMCRWCGVVWCWWQAADGVMLVAG